LEFDKQQYARSPLFYVGNKHKLLPQLALLFPREVNRLIEPFVGGGSVFMNTRSEIVIANDIDKNLIDIHRFLIENCNDIEGLLRRMTTLAQKFQLSCSHKGEVIDSKIREDFPKTYFAHSNRLGYKKLKDKYNSSTKRDALELYLLVIYGFNRMLRFNRSGEFNIPVGNVDFNSNVVEALRNYSDRIKNRNITFSSKDFGSFLDDIKFQPKDFVYVDPPYLITSSEYNKGWNEESENRLYGLLDRLDTQKIRFAVSNVVKYENQTNTILEAWMSKYKVHDISSNYINYFSNGKKNIKEVLVCNYV
jgi:DNA adenine methylase